LPIALTHFICIR